MWSLVAERSTYQAHLTQHWTPRVKSHLQVQGHVLASDTVTLTLALPARLDWNVEIWASITLTIGAVDAHQARPQPLWPAGQATSIAYWRFQLLQPGHLYIIHMFTESSCRRCGLATFLSQLFVAIQDAKLIPTAGAKPVTDGSRAILLAAGFKAYKGQNVRRKLNGA